MKFTTKLSLKSDKKDFCEGVAVIKQLPFNVEEKNTTTKFELNKQAMLDMGFELFKANTSKITWGIDEETKQLAVANLKGNVITDKDSNITANNTFSNLKFMDKLVKQFGIDPSKEHLFKLDVVEDGGYKVATLKPYVEESFEKKLDYETMEEAYPGHNQVMEDVINANVDDFDTTINSIHAQNEQSFI